MSQPLPKGIAERIGVAARRAYLRLGINPEKDLDNDQADPIKNALEEIVQATQEAAHSSAQPCRPASAGATMRKAEIPPDPDPPMTISELARRLGVRRASRQTAPNTVRWWCLQGIAGVVLDSWLEPHARMTSWGRYLAFVKKVARRKEEMREERLDAVRRVRKAPRIDQEDEPPRKGRARGRRPANGTPS
jgi:hypothetical protein